jgi:hypothetical protein
MPHGHVIIAMQYVEEDAELPCGGNNASILEHQRLPRGHQLGGVGGGPQFQSHPINHAARWVVGVEHGGRSGLASASAHLRIAERGVGFGQRDQALLVQRGTHSLGGGIECPAQQNRPCEHRTSLVGLHSHFSEIVMAGAGNGASLAEDQHPELGLRVACQGRSGNSANERVADLRCGNAAVEVPVHRCAGVHIEPTDGGVNEVRCRGYHGRYRRSHRDVVVHQGVVRQRMEQPADGLVWVVGFTWWGHLLPHTPTAIAILHCNGCIAAPDPLGRKAGGTARFKVLQKDERGLR